MVRALPHEIYVDCDYALAVGRIGLLAYTTDQGRKMWCVCRLDENDLPADADDIYNGDLLPVALDVFAGVSSRYMAGRA